MFSMLAAFWMFTSLPISAVECSICCTRETAEPSRPDGKASRSDGKASRLDGKASRPDGRPRRKCPRPWDKILVPLRVSWHSFLHRTTGL